MPFLDKSNGRGRLRVGEPVGAGGRLSLRIRASDINAGIPAINLAQIELFLNEAVIFEPNALAPAPRIVAAQENRKLLKGDLAYTRGDLQGHATCVFREPVPLVDPTTREIRYEGALGTAGTTRRAAPQHERLDTTAMPGHHHHHQLPPGRLTTATTWRPRRTRVLQPRAARPEERHGGSDRPSVYGEAARRPEPDRGAESRASATRLEPGHALARDQRPYHRRPHRPHELPSVKLLR